MWIFCPLMCRTKKLVNFSRMSVFSGLNILPALLNRCDMYRSCPSIFKILHKILEDFLTTYVLNLNAKPNLPLCWCGMWCYFSTSGGQLCNFFCNWLRWSFTYMKVQSRVLSMADKKISPFLTNQLSAVSIKNL